MVPGGECGARGYRIPGGDAGNHPDLQKEALCSMRIVIAEDNITPRRALSRLKLRRATRRNEEGL